MVIYIAMSAGIFTNCGRGQAAQTLILSAIYSPCCLLELLPDELRTALYLYQEGFKWNDYDSKVPQ